MELPKILETIRQALLSGDIDYDSYRNALARIDELQLLSSTTENPSVQEYCDKRMNQIREELESKRLSKTKEWVSCRIKETDSDIG